MANLAANVREPETREARERDIISLRRAALLNTIKEAIHRIFIPQRSHDLLSYIYFFPFRQDDWNLQNAFTLVEPMEKESNLCYSYTMLRHISTT